MSTTTVLTFDSTTPQQAYDLTLAFQRTCGLTPGMTLPVQQHHEPTVRVGGSAFGWTPRRAA